MLSLATLPARATVHAGRKLGGVLLDALTLPGDAATGKVDPMSPEGIGRALDFGGAAMTGGLGIGIAGRQMPANAIGSSGGMLLPEARGQTLAPAQPKGIRAYHGSPHDFDKFDLSKIGTGEGAQAYGHGLYFAESEGVAKNYRDVLGQKLYNGSKFNPDDPASIVGHHMNMAIQDGFVGDEAKEIAKHTISRKSFNNPKYAKALAMLDGGQIPTSANTGRMYEVRINAHPDQFLDWDKPLSQQSENVRRAFEKAFVETPADRDVLTENAARPVGRAFDYFFKDDASGTRSLRDAGIPGIRYLDQGSRSAGEGSYNYVVFDDKTIDILKKYGLLGAIMGPGAAAALQDRSGDQQMGLAPQ